MLAHWLASVPNVAASFSASSYAGATSGATSWAMRSNSRVAVRTTTTAASVIKNRPTTSVMSGVVSNRISSSSPMRTGRIKQTSRSRKRRDTLMRVGCSGSADISAGCIKGISSARVLGRIIQAGLHLCKSSHTFWTFSCYLAGCGQMSAQPLDYSRLRRARRASRRACRLSAALAAASPLLPALSAARMALR